MNPDRLMNAARNTGLEFALNGQTEQELVDHLQSFFGRHFCATVRKVATKMYHEQRAIDGEAA